MNADLRYAIDQAFETVQHGANPNGPLNKLLPAPLLGHLGSMSLLHVLVHHHQADLIDRALSLGSTTEPRLDQPFHLMALAAQQYSTPEADPDDSDTPFNDKVLDVVIQKRKENLLNVWDILQNHGIRCDPEALQEHYERLPPGLEKMSLDNIDPLLAMSVFSVGADDNVKDLLESLINRGACPKEAYRRLFGSLSPPVKRLFEQAIAQAEQAQLEDAVSDITPAPAPSRKM